MNGIKRILAQRRRRSELENEIQFQKRTLDGAKAFHRSLLSSGQREEATEQEQRILRRTGELARAEQALRDFEREGTERRGHR